MPKLSFRFYKDHEVRAVWNDDVQQWYFSVLDVIGAINEQDDYAKTRNYWKYLKNKLKKEGNELVSGTNHFIAFFLQFTFQILPIVACLGIIVLFIDCANDIEH